MSIDNYKDSSIDWIDNRIPENWKITRNKSVFKEISKLSKTGNETLLTVSHITGITPRSEKNVNMFFAETMEGYKLCEEGDLVINTMWAWMGALGTSHYKGICSPAYNVYRNINGVDYHHQYFDYLFRTPNFIVEMTRFSKGIVDSRLRLYPKDFFKIQTPLPPYKEQVKISSFLDHKTSTIDKKIALLEQKTAHYQQLRKSLINETVCRGLSKNVKLKDSGIEWIGKIPEHWEVKRFKDVVSKYTTGGTPTTSNTDYFNGTNTWICISDINDSKFVSKSKNKLTDEAIRSANILKTPKGSLLYSFKLSIGKMAFVETDVYTNEAILSIFPNKNIDLEYYYFMLPQFMLLAATENIYGAKMLNQKLIANALILHPPQFEQTSIAKLLDKKTKNIDSILTNLKTQIETLKELRKALINDVVTGKIKVIE